MEIPRRSSGDRHREGQSRLFRSSEIGDQILDLLGSEVQIRHWRMWISQPRPQAIRCEIRPVSDLRKRGRRVRRGPGTIGSMAGGAPRLDDGSSSRAVADRSGERWRKRYRCRRSTDERANPHSALLIHVRSGVHTTLRMNGKPCCACPGAVARTCLARRSPTPAEGAGTPPLQPTSVAPCRLPAPTLKTSDLNRRWRSALSEPSVFVRGPAAQANAIVLI